MGVAFDTLKFVEKLEAGGFTPNQARAASEAFADATGEQLATKADLSGLAAALKADISALSSSTKADLRETELRLEGKIEATKSEVLKWMFGQTLLILGAVIALSRIVH